MSRPLIGLSPGHLNERRGLRYSGEEQTPGLRTMGMVRCRLHFNMEGHMGVGGVPSQPALKATEGLSFRVVRWNIKLSVT